MKAWSVGHSEVGFVFVRCPTRGKAKTLHVHFGEDGCGIADLRARRLPILDGPGPARELAWITVPCEVDDCAEPWCWEGEHPDWAAIIAKEGTA